MMTAMARLPCKQSSSSPSQQPRVNNFGNSRNPYWDMQQARHPAPPYVRNHHRHSDHTGKRKSAVELLQETKAFYVKSETVLDRKQELKNSGHLQVSQLSAPGAPPPRLLRKCTGNSSACPMQPTSPSQLQPTPMTPPCCWASCHEQDRLDGILSPQQTLPPALPPKSPRLVPVPQRRTISGPPSSTGGDQLQTKLRRLLNTDSKENVFFSDSPPQSTTQSNGVSVTREEKFRYSPGSLSPGCREEDRMLHCPPQDVRFKFGRSNSHSHTSGRSSRKSNSSPSVENTICHKSLPDLHTSTRRRASLSPRASTKLSAKPSAHHQATNTSNCPDYETSSDYSDHSFKRDAVCYRSSRHIRRSLGSGGGDASSVLSSGGRTQKSSGSSKLSHGATARDSGGSSGHCTHRSEPAPRIQDCWTHIRRDSGASTQHSTEKDRSRKGSYIGGTLPPVVRHYSPDSGWRIFIICGHVVHSKWCSVIVYASSSDVELCNSENMTEIRSFMNLLFSLVLIILCIISQCLAALSDKQLCYNPDCSEPISLAKTAIVYISNDREVMSFNAGTEVKVFSKGAGKRTDLWGVEINGKRGFAPRSLLVEYKVLQRKLQYEVPVYKFTGEVNEVQPTELESRTEEKHKTHPLLKNKLLHDIEATSKSVKSIDESIVQESQVINVDNIISYEVIDGTTLYSDNEPSIQPNFVSKVVQATALPNEQASIDFIDSKINPDHKEPLSDKSTFIKKELQTDANDANGKLDKTKLSLDVHKETSTEILLENSAGLISLTLDTVSKDDTLIYDEGNKSEDELSTNLEHKEKSDNKIKTDNNAEESIEDNKKEEIMESVESKDIFASFTETFKMFSSSQDTTESTTIQNDDIPVSKAENNFQLKQVSEDIEAKDIASEKHIPTIQTELDSSIDSSLISKEKIEIQQEIIHENIESANVLDEKTKIEKEASIILLENATSSSDVPLSNNFVHKDTAKPAKKLPTTSSIEVDDSTTSSKTDINNIKNIQIGETSKEEKIIENIEDIDGSFVKDSIISGLKETTVIKSASTQSNSEVEQKLSENDKTHPEEDVSHTKTFDQVTINNKISETTNLSPETAIKENTKELFSESHTVEKNVMIDESLNHSATDISFIEKFVYSNVNKNDNSVDSLDNVPIEPNQFSNDVTPGILDSDQSLDSSQKEISNQITNFNEILQNQNLSDVEEDLEHEKDQFVSPVKEKETLLEYDDYINSEDKVLYKDEYTKEDNNLKKPESKSISDEIEDKVPSFDEYTNEVTTEFLEQKEESENEEDNLIDLMKLDNNYWKTLMFLCVTSVTVLVFTLGYYYIENIRRDKQLIARINTLEKEQLDLTLYIESIQEALSTQNESTEHNSNRFYEAKHRADKAEEEKTKLEEQVTVLEKDLENATEAGLELERMLREVLSSNNEINPLAQSVEDLKARLDAQQTANESLTNALNLKAQEIETLSADLVTTKKKYEELEIEFSRVQDELAILRNLKNNIEETLTDKVHNLEEQLDELVMEKSLLYKELKGKEIEIKELMEIVNQVKSNNLDLEKLYDVSHIKVDAQQLREERDELKMRLSDVEGAHQLLEEHMKLVKEEITALSDQCKIAEKEKKDAETRLEVLSKFFKEKEAERQKEETMWLQKQGEVVSTVERIHTMQSEIQNYKQQIEILKREIMDQEREYKNQISALETKAHEQWVAARQNERRLEESKAAAGQLRNRLTLVEKNLNLNDTDSEIKLHRLEANGETVTSPPLFMGAESSSSPVMFSGSSGVPPPPPPSYLHCFPPYLPPLPPTTSGLPPYDISQRPPPLGGRLSSPPPMPPPLHPQLTSGGRYENTSSPPPPMTPPHLLPSFNHHRSPLSLPFGDDRIPPLPPPGFPPPLGTTHPWGEESLPVPRNSGFHPHQREQRARNHKGSLHSSGESLDQKAHHGKI